MNRLPDIARRLHSQTLHAHFLTHQKLHTIYTIHAPHFSGPIVISARLLLFALLLLLLVLGLAFHAVKRSQNKVASTFSLQNSTTRAVSMLFTPNSGGWPSHLARHFSSAKVIRREIGLDLSQFLDRVISGDIEIREYDDLAKLFKGRLTFYDWNITLNTGPLARFTLLKWLAYQQLLPPQRLSETFRMLAACFQSHQISYVKGTKSTSRSSIICDLDFLSYDALGGEMQRIQRIYQAGTTIALEFTCVGPQVSYLSKDYVACAVPFRSGCLCKKLGRCAFQSSNTRTSAPLLASLKHIVSSISNSRASIQNAADVSEGQAVSLRKQEQELVDNKRYRHNQNKSTLDCWRQRRLLLVWEAGLMSAGLLQRWRIGIVINEVK